MSMSKSESARLQNFLDGVRDTRWEQIHNDMFTLSTVEEWVETLRCLETLQELIMQQETRET